MSYTDSFETELSNISDDLRASQKPFVLATVVRVTGSTSSNPGAKALLDQEGTILHGWLGGGCTRGAVMRIAKEALAEGTPKLISIAPEDQLEAIGVQSGDLKDGVKFARNGCPSGGSIDIFVEPVLPRPELVIFGASPVARALYKLAPILSWSVREGDTKAAEISNQTAFLIATQGQGDLDALRKALSASADYIAFVGSTRKFASLRAKLTKEGIAEKALESVQAPAGLDIGAQTPEEIALSILAELIQNRRSQKDVSDA